MGWEIEAKVQVHSFEWVRRRLTELGAVRLGRVWERNLLFDKECGDLKGKGCRLRLRIARDPSARGGQPLLTFKGPRRGGPFKSRREIEVAVADPSSMRRLLEAMGYVQHFTYRKRRETWELGGCRIELDDVPGLGRFVEVEGQKKKHIRRVMERLDLDDRPVIRRGYASLLARRQRERGVETLRAA